MENKEKKDIIVYEVICNVNDATREEQEDYQEEMNNYEEALNAITVIATFVTKKEAEEFLEKLNKITEIAIKNGETYRYYSDLHSPESLSIREHIIKFDNVDEKIKKIKYMNNIEDEKETTKK